MSDVEYEVQSLAVRNDEVGIILSASVNGVNDSFCVWIPVEEYETAIPEDLDDILADAIDKRLDELERLSIITESNNSKKAELESGIKGRRFKR